MNDILQFYHIERKLKEHKLENNETFIAQKTTRNASHAIFYPSINDKLFDFSNKGNAEYAYKYIPKHINLPKISYILSDAMTKTNCIISDHSLITLSTINRFNRAILGNQYRKLFIVYQLLQLFKFVHNEYNVAHGNLSPSLICINPNNLLLTVTGWFTTAHNGTNEYAQKRNDQKKNDLTAELLSRTCVPKKLSFKLRNYNESDRKFTEYKQSIMSKSELLRSSVYRWIHGELSNFEYIMELNKLCGRMKGDPFNHPVIPWVVDFSSPNDGWRDLKQSKFRLTKGDHQIDHTFLFSPQPHHITEVLSSLTYFLYLARRTPKNILQKAVRSRFEPKEYPISMQKLYQCVPEECIPEFYCDASIFESMIECLPNLQIPKWCSSPTECIRWHRNKLESKEVSQQLHNWIDLNFGFRLGQTTNNEKNNEYIFGYNDSEPCFSRIEAAINCKNIPLQFDPLLARHTGVMQLFNDPHPPQIGKFNKFYNPLLDNNHISLQQNMQIQRRIVEFGTNFLKLFSCTKSPQSLGLILCDKDNTLNMQSSVKTTPKQTSHTTSKYLKSGHLDLTSLDAQNNESGNEKNEKKERSRSKSLNSSPANIKISSSSTSTSKQTRECNLNYSYFAYDASGHGYVGYLNEQHRKRVGIISPNVHYKNTKDDIFSLGCVMTSIFTGNELFCYNSMKKHLLGMDVISGVLCKLPPAISSCIRSMVDRNPSNRPNVNEIIAWDSLFVYGMKEMFDLIQYIHEWQCKYKLNENMAQNVPISDHVKSKYIDLIKYVTSSLKLFPEMHPELFALIVPFLVNDIPICSDAKVMNESALYYYFKMIWCISSKLSEELCCYLLKKPFLTLLNLSNCATNNNSHHLILELLKPNTANFIRNHFGEYLFCKYYMKTIRLSLKSVNISIRKTAEIFLISMNKFMELKLIETAIIDPILDDLSNANVVLNAQEIRSFMMITQRMGEVFITKHVIPKMLKIINDSLQTLTEQQLKTINFYLIFGIIELLIYLLKPHRNKKFTFQTGTKFTDNTAIFKCLRLPLNNKYYFNLIEFKKLILLSIRIAQFFGPKSEITNSLLLTFEPMMIKLKERVIGSSIHDSFNVYTPSDCQELLFMIYTSFQSIFSEKQLDAELDQIELKSSKQIKHIVLQYMEQRKTATTKNINKKQTISLKDHSPPILEPSTWKINIHSSFYQQTLTKQTSIATACASSSMQMDEELNDESTENNAMYTGNESNNETDTELSESRSTAFSVREKNNTQQKDVKNWQFKANIHHIIQGHQPSNRILTIESKKSANLVLTGGSEGHIRMWRVEYRKLRDLTQYTQHNGPIKNISFLKYTDNIASCCGEIHVWDSAKNENICKFSPKQQQHRRKSVSATNLDLLMSTDQHVSTSTSSHKIYEKYTCMTPFNYCCLLAGNERGRIEFLDIASRSCSYDWEILPHSKLNVSKEQSSSKDHDHHETVSSHLSSASSMSGGMRRVTAISVRSNQREVAVGMSDGQIVILDLRNGFIVESFHEFSSQIDKLFWSNDNILIALCQNEGIYVFDCNQISRLYLHSTHKFDKYEKEKLFALDTNGKDEKSKKNKKKNKNKMVTIGNGMSMNEKFEIERNGEADFDKHRLHRQISKKLIEIGDASNMNDGDFKSVKTSKKSKNDLTNNGKNILFDRDQYFETMILSKDQKIRKKEVEIRTLLLNPNSNGNIDDFERYTEHIRAYHSYINKNNLMASNGMEQMNNTDNKEEEENDDDDEFKRGDLAFDEIGSCNNLLPFQPLISKPFLFDATPQIVAKYEPSKFDQKSLKTIKTNLSQFKITDFGLYKSNIICSIGKGIGYSKLKTPTQVLKDSSTFYTNHHSHNENLDFAQMYNSKMITRSFPSLKTKSSLSSLSILENMHLVIIGTNNGKIFTCG